MAHIIQGPKELAKYRHARTQVTVSTTQETVARHQPVVRLEAVTTLQETHHTQVAAGQIKVDAIGLVILVINKLVIHVSLRQF